MNKEEVKRIVQESKAHHIVRHGYYVNTRDYIRNQTLQRECVCILAVKVALLLYVQRPSIYWMTQHLHFGFFLITTCSICDASPAGTTVPRWTSTAPGAAFLSTEHGAFPLAPTLLSLFCLEAARGADCDAVAISAVLAGVGTGEDVL